ncbi:Putative flagella-related protein H [uncultured archaeon]|nr:Putative flagella-related protein H [uncultured archaeon]
MAGYSFLLDRDELNQMLGGGFPKGSLIMIDGPSGSGKSALCQRFAFGLLDNKHTVTYVSTQLTTKNFIRQMNSLDYPIGIRLLKGELLYIPVFPLLKESTPRIDFVQRLMGAEVLFEKNIIIIDTLSALVRYSINQEKSLELISFFKKLSGVQKTIILTIDSTEMPSNIVTEFKDAAEILMTIKMRQMGSEILRTAMINKYSRPEIQVGAMIGFKVEAKSGVMINISGVS